jgi:hypothetical protein
MYWLARSVVHKVVVTAQAHVEALVERMGGCRHSSSDQDDVKVGFGRQVDDVEPQPVEQCMDPV